MYKKTFGERFSKLLAEREWSDPVAAGIFKVSETMVKKYRAGENFPVTEKYLLMADTFGVSSDWLAGRSDVREIAKPGTLSTGC